MEQKASQESTPVMEAPSDEQLSRLVRDGERSAVAEIVSRHEMRLARIAYRITGCRHEAEDARHSVFVRLLQSVDQQQEIQSVGAWLTRCIVNESLTRVRRRNVEVVANAESATRARITTEPSPLDQMQLKESHDQLAMALNQMTADERALLSMRFDAGLAFREIAEVFKRPASTVKSQLAQAIDRLRKLLGVNG